MLRYYSLRPALAALTAAIAVVALTPDVAQATTGTLTINGSTSGSVVVHAPAVAGSTTFQLPGSNGTSGFCLQTDGTGVTSWASCGTATSLALSSLTAATTTDTIDSHTNAQTWNWSTLSTQTALTLGTAGLTTGTLLSLSNTSTVSSGDVLSATSATTSSGIGIYGAVTGHGNTGYAGYFTNTSTTGANYGLYASTSSASGWSVYADGTAPSYFGGNVGIGTTAPGSNLQVVQTSTTSDVTGINLTGNVSDVDLSLTNSSAGGTTWWLDSTGNGSGLSGGKLVIGNFVGITDIH